MSDGDGGVCWLGYTQPGGRGGQGVVRPFAGLQNGPFCVVNLVFA